MAEILVAIALLCSNPESPGKQERCQKELQECINKKHKGMSAGLWECNLERVR